MEAVGRSRAFSGTRFNCKLRIARKSNSATSPEGWEWVGSARRGFVERLTAVQAIQNGALLERNVTHSAFVDWHEDWQANRGWRAVRGRSSDRDWQAGPGWAAIVYEFEFEREEPAH
jgi:hypothetical protein